MKLEDIRVCVLRIEGTNCEQEMFHCFRRLGASPEFVHLNQLVSRGIDAGRKRSLSDYQILMVPGGFSAGDYVRAGAIWAARMKSNLRRDLARFIDSGKAVGGICNGFQVLVELGALPGIGTTLSDVPQAVLNINDSSRFECRPTFLRAESRGSCVFTREIPRGAILNIPSAHAEGKFMLPAETKDKLLKRLIERDQVVFRYTDPDGGPANYPWSPNGALDSIAGICNEHGNVFGMMPHPERVFFLHQHPSWTRKLGVDPSSPGDGRAVFESVIKYTAQKF